MLCMRAYPPPMLVSSLELRPRLFGLVGTAVANCFLRIIGAVFREIPVSLHGAESTAMKVRLSDCGTVKKSYNSHLLSYWYRPSLSHIYIPIIIFPRRLRPEVL